MKRIFTPLITAIIHWQTSENMPPKANKEAQLKGEEAELLIENYLREQYRPYSVGDIVLNLHNKITKPNVVKALDNLVARNSVVCKSFGKLNFYVSSEEIEEMDAESELSAETIEQMNNEIKELEKEIKDLSSIASSNNDSLPNQELLSMLKTLNEENKKLQIQFDELNDPNVPKLSQEDLQKANELSNVVKTICLQRKHMFENFSNTIKENLEDYKKLFETIGIEEINVEVSSFR